MEIKCLRDYCENYCDGYPCGHYGYRLCNAQKAYRKDPYEWLEGINQDIKKQKEEDNKFWENKHEIRKN